MFKQLAIIRGGKCTLVRRGVYDVTMSKRNEALTLVLALSGWSYPDNVFYRTPKGQVDYQTLGRLSWISCLTKSWWYSEKLWSFQTLTVHNHQDRWRNLAPKTSRVSVPVAYSAPPVSKPARNTSWVGPRSRTVQTTCLLEIQPWRINSKKKIEISNKLKQQTPILTSDQTLFDPTVLLTRNRQAATGVNQLWCIAKFPPTQESRRA